MEKLAISSTLPLEIACPTSCSRLYGTVRENRDQILDFLAAVTINKGVFEISPSNFKFSLGPKLWLLLTGDLCVIWEMRGPLTKHNNV